MDGTQLGNLTLPSGGTVEFVDIDDLTGGDLQAIRREIRTADAAGETSNALLAKIIELTVKAWDVKIPDPRIPRENPAGLRKLSLRDLLALERHVQPVLGLITDAADDGKPGSPPRPESE
jgi:hypothetical protein